MNNMRLSWKRSDGGRVQHLAYLSEDASVYQTLCGRDIPLGTLRAEYGTPYCVECTLAAAEQDMLYRLPDDEFTTAEPEAYDAKL